MKSNIHASFTLAALLICSAKGATGTFGSYAEIFTTTNTTVYVAQQHSGSNPAFNGADLGAYEVTDTLGISNASVLTYKNDGGDVTGAELNYRIYETGTTAPSFQAAAINFGSNSTSTDLGGNTFSGGGDQEWQGLAAGNVNLLSGITDNGNYTVEIFYRAFTSDGDQFSNNSGSNYSATFNVVPEPSTALLSGLALCGLVIRRR